MKLIWTAGWLAAGSLFAFQAQTPPPPTASIDGQVFNLATGAPLKRASVRLSMVGRGGGGPGGGGRGGGPQAQMRETDEQGRFSFPYLEAGRYMLSAERQGFLRQNYGARKYTTSGTPIPLTAGQQLKDLVIKLNPQSVIVGKVLDDEGEPVANVQVRAYQMGYRGGKKQWVQVNSGSANDIGEYRIPALEPGKYLVATSQSNRPLMSGQTPSSVPLPDSADQRWASTYYPSTTEQLNAVPVDVAAGAETRGIDIRLVKARVFRVRGRVQAPEGGRPPMVTMTTRDGSRTLPNMGPARPPDYRFEIAGVAPGSYYIYAQFGDRNLQQLAMQSIDVQNRHIDNIVLSPTPAGDVSGTVKLDDAAAGTTVDLSKINVILRPSLDIVTPPRGRPSAGVFVLKNVAPLHYSISVNQLPDGCYVKSIVYGGREVPEDGVDIAPGGTLAITIGADAGAISAAVLDKDGKPLGGSTVALVSKDGAPVRGSTADENGAVSFSGLRPGDYTVIAWDDIPQGAYYDPEFLKKYSGTPVKVEPRGKQAIQVKATTVE